MPELRKDPVLGRWVIIATERAKRPMDFRHAAQTVDASESCPFCPGNESMTPPEITALREPGTAPNQPGWQVRVVPNKYPALRVEGQLGRRARGLYDSMDGVGAHEVVLEGPEHVPSLTDLPPQRVQQLIRVYRGRMLDLKRDRRLVYGLVFKNVGSAAGASLEHTHSQIICLPTVPKTPWREIAGCEIHWRHRGRCLYCHMIEQELEEGARMVLETERYVAFIPYASRFPFETWVLPRKHASHFEACTDQDADELGVVLHRVLGLLERALDRPPYNYVIHSSPFDVSELRHYHWHLEILPRITGVAGFEWGTDFYINPVAPEDAAAFLREIAD